MFTEEQLQQLRAVIQEENVSLTVKIDAVDERLSAKIDAVD